MIQSCIEEDFETYIGDNKSLIEKTLHIKSLANSNNIQHKMELVYWNNSSDMIGCHLDNEPFKTFKSVDDGIKYFKNKNYNVKKIDQKTTKTGCVTEIFNISK